MCVPQVETLGERIVLYILNRVIYRAKEMSSSEGEVPFLCHGEKDYAKIHWNNGEAVGFYSVKPSGNLCCLMQKDKFEKMLISFCVDIPNGLLTAEGEDHLCVVLDTRSWMLL